MRNRRPSCRQIGSKKLARLQSSESDKFRGLNLELKHRLCLLEFGLGLIANIVEANPSDIGPKSIMAESRDRPVECCCGKKELIQSMVEVLNNLESVLAANSAMKTSKCETAILKAPFEETLTLSSLELGTSHKPRIFIDEIANGGNMLSEMVGNSVTASTTVPYIDPASLDALSTLASVAVATSTKYEQVDRFQTVPLKKRRLGRNVI